MKILILWAAVIISLIPSFSQETVMLRRYERINSYAKMEIAWAEKAYTYMDVADTTLDSARPDRNFGGSKTLWLKRGQNNKILLQFDQLNRAIWRGSRIVDAYLVLYPVPGQFAKDTRVNLHRMTTEWRDGGADGAPMYWTATHQASHSSPRNNAIRWHAPGASGARDRLSTPSHHQNSSDGYDPASNRWVLRGEGLLRDVRYWFERQHRNFGWSIELEDPKKAHGDLQFYSSETMEKSLRPTLVVTFEPLMSEGIREGIDLNVTFISRTPRYLRYNDNGRTTYERQPFRRDRPGIMKFPDFEKEQKWPKPGDRMTYTAHVKNSGFAPYRGKLDYLWRYNGTVIEQGTVEVNLAPEQTRTFKIIIPWKGDLSDIRDEKLWFEVDPNEKIVEITRNNNAQSKYLKARSWKYWVERSAYEYTSQFLTAYGSYAFEDYLKWHEQMWNETFLNRSRFDDLAPDGSTQRISLDDFEIVEDGRLRGFIHRLDDKPDFHFDGEWGTETLKGDDLKDPEKVKNTQNFLRATRIFLEGSLLHEACHQVLGAFDVYWSNQEPSEPHQPNGKVKLKDGGDYYITRGAMYAYSGLMGGDDCRPNEHYTESSGLFELHSIMGFNANTPYRNGFYGEWQYDLPRSIFARILAADGSPIPEAKVRLWQCSANEIRDEDLVADGLVSDKQGVLKLPDQDSGEKEDYTTLTGHTLLKKNPFGRIDVVGVNTVLLMRIEAYGQVDYRFIRLYELNRAYWRGQKEVYTHDVQSQIAPAVVNWSRDLARGKAVQTALNPADASLLTDGDRTTRWSGGIAPAGAYLQVDLGDEPPVAAVRLVQREGHGEFFPRFKVEVSDDPTFRTGVMELFRQFPYSFRHAMTNDRDIDPQDTTIRWVTYGARPSKGRYLRITSLEDGHAQLSAVEVFGVQ